MKGCFYKVRKICQVKNCQRTYTGICRNNDGLKYQEEEMPEIEMSLKNINLLEKKVTK